MTTTRRGTAFERQVRKWYEEQGGLVVGARGPVDLVVIQKQHDPRVILVSRRMTTRPAYTKRHVRTFLHLWKMEELEALKNVAAAHETGAVLAWKIQREWGLFPLHGWRLKGGGLFHPDGWRVVPGPRHGGGWTALGNPGAMDPRCGKTTRRDALAQRSDWR